MNRLPRTLAATLALAVTGCGTGLQAPATQPVAVQVRTEAQLPRFAPPPAADEAVAGEAIVRFGIGEVAPLSLPGATRLRPVPGVENAWVYRLSSGAYTEGTTQSWDALKAIAYAEPVYTYHTMAYPVGEDQTLYGLNVIQAPKAWDRVTAKRDVIVAVIDTGVDYNHPDLAGAVIKGPDIVNDDDDPMDDQGHGTHCAGTIGAAANGAGIVGVAHGARILAIKVLNARGSGNNVDIAAGIDAAVKGGAKVISLSLGGPESRATRDAIRAATEKGVLCVAAAGNDNSKRPSFPGAQPEALGVGSSDSRDRRSTFSNYGDTVDISAPGTDIMSLAVGGGYRKLSGTSMATPHVAGAAAVLLSQQPDLGVARLRQLLETSGDKVTGFTETPAVKRLNLAKALDSLDAPAVEVPGTPGGPDAPVEDRQPAVQGLAIGTKSTSAVLSWKTEVPARCTVTYGLGNALDHTVEVGSAFTSDHKVTIKDLKRMKTYSFRIVTTARNGQSLTTRTRTFKTRLIGSL
ncbi:MAG: S8 family serine peptidase [Candidatus Sericytochromatia bacterium]|nr:S8 family serine peptidase [Candidatus Sericytochromatia bacterium]